jgi:hypothetical protein
MVDKVEAILRRFTDELREAMREELSAQVTAAVQSSLGGKATKGVRNAVKTRGGKRTSEEIAKQAQKVLKIIQDNPGKRSEEIAKVIGLSTGELVAPLKKLLADKEIGAKGKARGTMYTAKS